MLGTYYNFVNEICTFGMVINDFFNKEIKQPEQSGIRIEHGKLVEHTKGFSDLRFQGNFFK